ncbi:hypothetical protein MBLNU457_3833t1 [Dothideomycetes sp. NU457]
MSAQPPGPFIYINGYPGIGKLTIARELQKLIPNSRLVHNHALIDATSSVYARDEEDYQPLRQAMRRTVLSSISQSATTRSITWIFTDSQSSDAIGSACSTDYLSAAQERGSEFFSVVLSCSLEENLRRLVIVGRGEGGGNGKLVDVGILKMIRETEDVYHFGGERECEIDVSEKSAGEVAREIMGFIGESRA